MLSLRKHIDTKSEVYTGFTDYASMETRKVF